MKYEILKNLLGYLQSDELQIKTFADLLKFKEKHNIHNNKELMYCILIQYSYPNEFVRF